MTLYIETVDIIGLTYYIEVPIRNYNKINK